MYKTYIFLYEILTVDSLTAQFFLWAATNWLAYYSLNEKTEQITPEVELFTEFGNIIRPILNLYYLVFTIINNTHCYTQVNINIIQTAWTNALIKQARTKMFRQTPVWYPYTCVAIVPRIRDGGITTRKGWFSYSSHEKQAWTGYTVNLRNKPIRNSSKDNIGWRKTLHALRQASGSPITSFFNHPSIYKFRYG